MRGIKKTKSPRSKGEKKEIWWVIKSPNGSLELARSFPTQKGCINVFLMTVGGSWLLHELAGYSCVKIEVREAKK